MQTFYHILLSFSAFKVESKTILIEVKNVEKKPDGKDYDIEKIFTKNSCQIHHQCQSGEVCTKSGICKALACQADIDCENEINLPSSCVHIMPGGPKFCDRDTNCESDAECAKPGQNYRCQSDTHQCKPSYGPCDDTCDCLTEYNMAKEEAVCDHTLGGVDRVCMCRSENVAECQSGQEPESEVPILPAIDYPPLVPDGGEAQQLECPAPVYKPPGKEGESCKVHSACFDRLDLICAVIGNQEAGDCMKLSCRSDEDCSKQTILPTYCTGGLCHRKTCYTSKECPKGYACDSAGQCKQNLGSCMFPCDCSDCDETECFHETCLCSADHDECVVSPGHGQKNRTNTTNSLGDYHIKSPSQRYSIQNTVSGTKCEIEKCPSDWKKFATGCYKIFSGKMTFQKAFKLCHIAGGYLAEITTKKEDDHLKVRTPVWVGAQKTEGEMVWSSLRTFDYFPVGYQSADPGNCLLKGKGWWRNTECNLRKSVLCEIAPLNMSNH